MNRTFPLFSLVSAATLAAAAPAQIQVDLDLGADLHDIAIDAPRDRAYVSIPTQSRVAIVDTNTWMETGDFTVAPNPQGLALSIDGTRLFVAKNGAGAVAVIDLASGAQTEILLTTLLDDPRTYDVIEARPGELFVSSNPSSNGFAYIVRVDLANGNAAARVASNRIIRCAPTFEVNPARTALYVGACFSPNSIYKLDITIPTAPIVAEDDHGSVSGTSHVEVSPDGSRVHLRSGQILDPDTLDVVGLIGGGIARYDVDPTRVFVTASPNQIQTWNVVSQTQVDTSTVPCTFGTFNVPREFVVLEGEAGFVALQGTRVCGIADVPPCVASVTSYCSSLPNSTGSAAMLGGLGEPRIAQNQFSIQLADAPAETFALLLYSSESAQLPLGDGWLCLSPFAGIRRLGSPARVDTVGTLVTHLDFTSAPLLNSPVTAFSTWKFQAWYRDAIGSGINTSDALEITFCP